MQDRKVHAPRLIFRRIHLSFVQKQIADNSLGEGTGKKIGSKHLFFPFKPTF
jgi:hypothetical protein